MASGRGRRSRSWAHSPLVTPLAAQWQYMHMTRETVWCLAGLLPSSFPTSGATETVEVDPPRAGPGSSPSAAHTGAATFRSPQEQAKEVVSQVGSCPARMLRTAPKPPKSVNMAWYLEINLLVLSDATLAASSTSASLPVHMTKRVGTDR